MTDFVKYWISSQEINRKLGICRISLWSVLTGKTKQIGGYKWRYFKNPQNMMYILNNL